MRIKYSMPTALTAIALTAMTLTARADNVPSPSGPLTHHSVSLSMAMTMAQEAIARCKADGFSVTVVVVNRAGDSVLLYRSDTANPHNAELARRKAYTALTFHRTSRDWMQSLVETPALAAQRDLKDVIALSGGAPLMLGDEAIGAIGVSGATLLNEDDKCAKAGIDKVSDDLKKN